VSGSDSVYEAKSNDEKQEVISPVVVYPAIFNQIIRSKFETQSKRQSSSEDD
jgi:hypothetical protein